MKLVLAPTNKLVVMSCAAAGPLVRVASSCAMPKERTVAVDHGKKLVTVIWAFRFELLCLLMTSRASAPLALRAA